MKQSALDADTLIQKDLDRVFGRGPGRTPEDRCCHSTRRFVRSHTGLAFKNDGATGLEISASDALSAFGWDILQVLSDKPATSLVREPQFRISAVLPRVRKAAQITELELAEMANVTEKDILGLELGLKRMPMDIVARVARALNLCPIRFGAVDCELTSAKIGEPA